MGDRASESAGAMITVAERSALDLDWQEQSLCRHADPNLFFPPTQGERPEERVVREARAKEICAQCPVRRECLDYALSAREGYGVWGGLNELERRDLLTKRAG